MGNDRKDAIEWEPFTLYSKPVWVLYEGELAVYIPGEIKPIKVKENLYENE